MITLTPRSLMRACRSTLRFWYAVTTSATSPKIMPSPFSPAFSFVR